MSDELCTSERLLMACEKDLEDLLKKYNPNFKGFRNSSGAYRSSNEEEFNLILITSDFTLGREKEFMKEISNFFYGNYPVKSVANVIHSSGVESYRVFLDVLPMGWDAYFALKNNKDVFDD